MDNARAWAVRSKPHHIPRMREFLAHGMVAIGWPGLGDLTGIDRDEIRRRLEPQPYTRGDPRKIGRQSGELERFVNEMTAGDFVVVPNGADIYVAEVVSDYIYRADEERPEDGYSHWRMVRYLNDRKPFAREELPDELARALRCQITVFSVPIQDVWSLVNVPGPPPAEHFVRPPIVGIQELLERIESGRKLPERNMEAAVEDLLRRLGHNAKRIVFQSGRIDVAINDSSGKPEFVFEVKRSISQRTVRDQARRQAFDYAARTGARFVILTDSDRYEIYDRQAGLDHDSMLMGSFQLTKFRREDVAMLDELRPTAGTP